MNTHLQECIYTPENIDHDKGIRWGGSPCICDELRACEQRVLSLNPIAIGVLIAQRARERALDTAQEAIAALDKVGQGQDYVLGVFDSLSAIETLKHNTSP